MTGYQIFVTIGLSVLSILVIPALGFLIRITIKWTRVEDKLDHIADDMVKLVQDKDKVHLEITRQMSDDRKATDRRLRWLEENVWKGGRGRKVTGTLSFRYLVVSFGR